MGALWGTPRLRAPGPGTHFRHTSYAHSIPGAETKKPAPLMGIRIICKYAQYCNCSLRNSLKVCAFQAIPLMYYLPRKMLLLLCTQYTLAYTLYGYCINAFLYLNLEIKMPILPSNKKAEIRRLTASSSFKYSKSPQGTIKLKN